MENNKLLWLVVISYLVLSVGAGVLTARREKQVSVKGYFHSTISPTVLAFTIVATGQSGVALVGLAGTVFANGLGIWVAGTTGSMIGYSMTNLILGRPMSRISALYDKTNVPDMLSFIYKEERLRYIAVPTILLIAIIFCSAEWTSLGHLIHTLIGASYQQSIIISAIVVGTYAIAGGNKSTAIVSAVQIGVAIVSCLILFGAAMHIGGGLTELHRDVKAVNPEFLRITGSDGALKGKAISYLLIYSFGMMGQPQLIVKYFQIKSPKMLPKCLFMTTATFCITNITAIVGLVSIAKVASGEMIPPAASDGTMAAFIAQFCNPVIGGLVVSACLAAIMSTIAALLLSASSAMVSTILGDWLNVDLSGKRGVSFSRWSMLGCLMISTLLALNPYADIFTMGAQAWGGYAATFTPAVVLGLRWRRSTGKGAFCSMITGAVIYFICLILNISGIWEWPLSVDFPVYALAASTVVMIAVSLRTPVEDKSFFMPPVRTELRHNTEQ